MLNVFNVEKLIHKSKIFNVILLRKLFLSVENKIY